MASSPAVLDLDLPFDANSLEDLLNPGIRFPVENRRVRLDPLPQVGRGF